AITHLHTQGTTHYIEIGPDTTLTTLNTHTLTTLTGSTPHPDTEPTCTATLHPKHTPTHTLTTALTDLYTHGVTPDWDAVTPPAPRLDLPTYPFQRQRHWFTSSTAGDVTAAGLESATHALLGAATALPDGGHLFTGRLSTATQPWLADHTVMDTVLLPGTAYVDLALHAARHTGCDGVAELTLRSPLVLAENRAVQLQVMVAAPDDAGNRRITVHSRAESARDARDVHDDADGDTGGTATTGDGLADPAENTWTEHAHGVLSGAGECDAPPRLPESWPPSGASAVDVGDFYGLLSDRGYQYGLVFQGLRAAWRDGDTWYAEIGVEDAPDGAHFGIHPALLDSALHPLGLDLLAAAEGAEQSVRLPFSWSGVTLYAPGAAATLRVRLARTGENTLSLTATDPAGAPVVAVESLTTRPVTPEQLAPAGGDPGNALFAVEWFPEPAATSAASAASPAGERTVAVLGEQLAYAAGRSPLPEYADLDALAEAVSEGRATAPDVLLAALPDEGAGDDAHHPEDSVQATDRLTAEVLALSQRFLADDGLAGTRLTFVTHNAITTNLAQATVWGLIRTAQAEHPHRFGLVDLDTPPRATPVTDALLADLSTGDPQNRIRDGVRHTPRLVPVAPENEGTAGTPIDPDGTILITGGTGTLGSLVAR
ncbi:polyketide synthase dehydratase domain-containing protein, partial [Streptomyces sp. NPDC020917]|uniref:polyketide synthase dehydratase domain-containing protein n=1 Tax=Streptomyces sp. NPDC020917 TaxID=3365102 RepID=UPI00379619E8